jgi:5-formyltetrahydrofolate cyclo-ligase
MNALEADFDSDLAAAKKAAREAALARRAAAHGDLRNRFGANYAGDQLMRYFFSAISPAKGIPVSGFWPVKEEIDVRPLMSALHARGHPCGLPVIVAKRTPLMFRRWDPKLPLVEGRWGIPTPPEDAPEVIPELVLVPLLAFDSGGNRLGYGAGFYDRTLALLRARPGKQTLAVGVGFAAQQVDAVPCDATDEVLDWVVTEKGATCFAAPR